jgi:hypothetical protein
MTKHRTVKHTNVIKKKRDSRIKQHHKTQRVKRDLKIKEKRNTKCLVFVTHGWYEDNTVNNPYKSFVLPKNVKLIKYSKPGDTLSNYAVNYITNTLQTKGCNFKLPPMLYYIWDDGFIAQESTEQYDCRNCQDMTLHFSDDIPSKYYTLGRMGTYELNSSDHSFKNLSYHIKQRISLQEYLSRWIKKYPNTNLVFHQLTCHESDISNYIPPHKNLKTMNDTDIEVIINNLGERLNKVLQPNDIPYFTDIMKANRTTIKDKNNMYVLKYPTFITDNKSELTAKINEINKAVKKMSVDSSL